MNRINGENYRIDEPGGYYKGHVVNQFGSGKICPVLGYVKKHFRFGEMVLLTIALTAVFNCSSEICYQWFVFCFILMFIEFDNSISIV